MKTLFILLFVSLFGLGSNAQTYKGNYPKANEDKLNEEYCTGLFKTTDGTIFDIASEISAQGYFNILDWMQGRIAGYQVYKTWSGTSVPLLRGGVPSIFLDEVQVSPATLNSLSVHDIAMVKVIKTPFFGGFNGGHGAIAVYTLKGEDEEEESDSDPK